ncbi:hypothetical protein [Streptomyces sp. NPDC059850]|uniref:hypothetical protein n=1 Tax=Streptomyces sp. NPDC059850 TaxID=3346970 RepID=UPI003665E5DA
MKHDKINSIVNDEEFFPFWEAIAWSAVQNAVMFGEIDVAELSNKEVVMAAIARTLYYLKGDEEDYTQEDEERGAGEDTSESSNDTQQDILWSSSHEPDLKAQADDFLNRDKSEFATLFYATWIEHWINRIILLRLAGERVHENIAASLVRTSKIELKMGKIWTSLGMPTIEKELLRRVTRVMESRNGFVHYKWPHDEESAHTDRINRGRVQAQEAKSTVEALMQLEDDVFYDGRTAAIKEAFKASWKERMSRDFG